MIMALPGDKAKDHYLREDMEAPATWGEITYWPADGWKTLDKTYQELLDFLKPLPEVTLIGYSRGGYIISRLSNELINIKAAVLYESPVYNGVGGNSCTIPGGNFPVLLIWNSFGALDSLFRSKRKEAIYSLKYWSINRKARILIGDGGHVKREDWEFRHNWDTDLNDQIGEWLNEQS